MEVAHLAFCSLLLLIGKTLDFLMDLIGVWLEKV
ncbi:hypothetical protein Gotri_013605 [Gossypium trilobum]|uniref:Uncharacterized protein n=1 Tax=Gossypium trilobum TaxID=34281 RepID=A0A7J9DU79_9ROSI|nr:hypothetical protein [Gossypium trilobum]